MATLTVLAAATMVPIGAIAAASLVVNWNLTLVLVSVVTSMTLLIARGAFRTRMVPDVSSLFARFAIAAILGVFVGTMANGLIGQPVPTPTAMAALAAVLFFGLTFGTHLGLTILKSSWAAGRLRSRGIIIGSSRLADELVAELRIRPTYGVDVVGLINDHSDHHSSIANTLETGELAELADIVERTAADRLIIGPAAGEDPSIIAAARWAARRGMPVYVVPRFYAMGMGMDSLSPDRLRGYPLVRLQRSSHPMIALRIKRAIDIAVSGTALLLLSPIMALAALAVRLTSPGPILFTQERVGQDGKLITVPKFRSMADVPKSASDNEWTSDKRITPVGNLLRRTAIDELPQLFLIFKGDMSLVGPRPERPSFVEQFASQYPDYAHRHRMTVGLTGLAQVAGLVGDTSIAERVKYDNIYIDQWTLGMDFQIMFKTVWSILRQSEYKARQQELASVLEQSPGESAPTTVGFNHDVRAGLSG
jgi:exopolysaccharide biosynthesis polyprenyl glycosylphosphotransferase